MMYLRQRSAAQQQQQPLQDVSGTVAVRCWGLAATAPARYETSSKPYWATKGTTKLTVGLAVAALHHLDQPLSAAAPHVLNVVLLLALKLAPGQNGQLPCGESAAKLSALATSLCLLDATTLCLLDI